MSVDNYLGLPEEVFEIILQHLDTEDVLSCSLVCLGWRNAVNSDRIWEKLCRKNISEERLKLRAERKRVGSSYEVFETENLLMLCKWRRRYMDDVELKRNWKNGCFKEDFITVYDYFSLYVTKLETDNELLLVPKDSGPVRPPYTVFNIVDQPIMTGEIKPALPNHGISLLKLSNNILVIVQETLLHVYVKNEDKNLKLNLLALFDRNHSKTIPDTPDLTNWYEQNGYRGYPNIMCDHNGKYFVAMHTHYDDDFDELQYSHLHIWDLEFQTKIQEVALPMQMPGEQLECASLILRGNIVHLILTYQSCTSIYAYDVEKSSYSETVLQLEGCLECELFTGTVAVMLNRSEEKLILFDLRDGRMLDTLTIRHISLSRSVQAFGNRITYAEYGYPSTVNVYDTDKLRLMDKFQFECQNGFVNRIHIVMDDIMLICTDMQLLIRDMKAKEILRTVECIHFLPPDPSCSKLVVKKPDMKLVVLHFW